MTRIIRAALAALLAAGCAAPGPETYGGNQEKQPRSYPPEMLRLLPL